MKSAFSGYASFKRGEPLRPFEFDPGELGADQVEIVAEYCGICHSDVSMLENDWGMTKYPIVPGYEVVGKVVAVGSHAKSLRVGQRVGIGWMSGVPLPRGCPAPTGLRPAARVN